MYKDNMDAATAFGIEGFVNDTDLLESEKTARAKARWLEFWAWVETN